MHPAAQPRALARDYRAMKIYLSSVTYDRIFEYNIDMRARCVACLALSLGLALAGTALAESVTGVCPDGSFFVVPHIDGVPCARAKLVDPTDLPPIRPQLLPRPYTWYVDQQARDPNNPYNLLEAAETIREARDPHGASTQPTPQPLSLQPAVPAPVEPRRADVVVPQFSEAELRDLVRLIEMRQRIARAELLVEDLRGGHRLRILLAYSGAFEAGVLDWAGLDPKDRRVIAFAVLAPSRETEFQPNFFVVQGSRTFRPDPRDARELGLLVGAPGTVPGGGIALGYLVVPATFDPTESMELWWNDRSVATVLNPQAAGRS